MSLLILFLLQFPLLLLFLHVPSSHNDESTYRELTNSITPAPMLLAYHFFSVALYSIYILFTSGVPPPPGQKGRAPRIHEYPYTAYLAFRVVCPLRLFRFLDMAQVLTSSSGLLVLFSYRLFGPRYGLERFSFVWINR